MSGFFCSDSAEDVPDVVISWYGLARITIISRMTVILYICMICALIYGLNIYGNSEESGPQFMLIFHGFCHASLHIFWLSHLIYFHSRLQVLAYIWSCSVVIPMEIFGSHFLVHLSIWPHNLWDLVKRWFIWKQEFCPKNKPAGGWPVLLCWLHQYENYILCFPSLSYLSVTLKVGICIYGV